MVITLKNYKKIRFPVYKIDSFNYERVDGLLFIDNKLVDDKNMKGETLGVRRIQTPHTDLYVLNKKIDTLIGILKQDSKTFIDSNGVPFIYEKTKFCKLKYHRIHKIELKESQSLLWLKGINFPMHIPRPPAYAMKWAGLLYYENLPWLLYEYSEDKKKDRRKKV